MRVAGPNISPGPGSVVARYRAEDWERTIRHGIKPGGQPAMVMPSEDFNRFTDHGLAPQPPVPEALTVEHGCYVGQGCHGPNLSGGRVPGTPPDWPAAANLTPGEGSAMARYPRASDFQTTLRTGHRPDGSAVSPVMPSSALSKMSTVDTGALCLYLKSLPPRAAGQH